MLNQICFEVAPGRQLLLAGLEVEDFDRYMEDVNRTAQVFRGRFCILRVVWRRGRC